MKHTVGRIIEEATMDISTRIQGIGVLMAGYNPDGYDKPEKLQSVGTALQSCARELERMHNLFDHMNWLQDSPKASIEVEYYPSEDPLSAAIEVMKKIKKS